MELNESNVIEVLSELLPYIEADGGWLEFVEIDRNLDEQTRMYYGVKEGEGGIVKVRLGGACSTCAMSSMTLKQGIETALQAQWPEISQVIQV